MTVQIPATYRDDKLLHREGEVLVDFEGDEFSVGHYTDDKCESIVFDNRLLDPLQTELTK